VLIAVVGWMNQQQQDAIDYLREENRILRKRFRCENVATVIS
jgi:hypothetical protein